MVKARRAIIRRHAPLYFSTYFFDYIGAVVNYAGAMIAFTCVWLLVGCDCGMYTSVVTSSTKPTPKPTTHSRGRLYLVADLRCQALPLRNLGPGGQGLLQVGR